jgi:hypothetical protein
MPAGGCAVHRSFCPVHFLPLRTFCRRGPRPPRRAGAVLTAPFLAGSAAALHGFRSAARGSFAPQVKVRELGIAAVFRVPTLKWARSGMRVLKPGLEGKRAMEQTYMLTQHSLAGGSCLRLRHSPPSGPALPRRSRRSPRLSPPTGTDPEGAVGIRPLPRLAAEVCGGLLPLPGAAWLLRSHRDHLRWRRVAYVRLVQRGVRPATVQGLDARPGHF